MKKLLLLFLGLGISLPVVITSCQKELSCESCSNQLSPIAKAGTDLIIYLPMDSTILDGRTSVDPDGTIATWRWVQLAGPVAVQIGNPDNAVTIAKNFSTGSYVFELTVTDNHGLSATDSMQINVIDPSAPNRPPVAHAGADQFISLLQNTAILDGTGSSDPDNNIIEYRWAKISGPASYSILNNTAIQTPAQNLMTGDYHFELKITDAGGLSSKDTVVISVIDQVDPCNIVNRPIINAQLIPIGNLSITKIFAKAAATNNKLVFAGGISHVPDYTGLPTRRIDIYDINTNTWTIKDVVDLPPYRIDLSVAAVADKILVAGGGFWGDDIYTDRVDVYNTSTNSWSLDAISEARGALEAVSSQNKAFFAGGYSYSNILGNNYWANKVDIFDHNNNSWSTANLSEGRGYVSTAAAGNKVYFAGGENNNGTLQFSDRIDIYDISNNSWTTSSLQQPISRLASISAGTKVFFAGGYNLGGPTGHVEIRDIITGVKTSACIIPRSSFSAVKRNNQVIFFTGLGSAPGNGTHFEMYDMSTNLWFTVIMNKKIQGASIICYNNIIYVAGGWVNDVGSSQVWKLDF
jgi:hypothetical protein